MGDTLASGELTVPSALQPAFRQFRRDFETVTNQWVMRDEESEESVSAMRTGLRRYLSGGVDTDAMRAVFAFWRDLAVRMCPNGVAVRPALPLHVEVRHMDREWKRGEGQ